MNHDAYPDDYIRRTEARAQGKPLTLFGESD